MSVAQSLSSNDYVITKFGLEKGLPQSSVNDIIQTEDGYIWLATFGGLVRFDGNSFTTFNRSNSAGFGSDRILHLFEDSSGAIWLSTERGFTSFKDEKFRTITLKDVGAINSPQRVVEDLDGRIWGLADGITYYFGKDTLIEKKVLTEEKLISEALSDKDGVYLAFRKKILHTLRDSVVLIRDFEAEFRSEISDIKEYPKDSGTIYIATSRDGLFRYENEKLVSYKDSEGFSSNYIKNLFIDRDSTFWVTTYNGISKFSGKEFEIFDPIKADFEINFTKVFKDNEDNYWLGTQGDGLFSARPSIIKNIGREEGFENDIMLSLNQLKDGRMLFSTNCGGIYEWFQGELSYSILNTHLPNLCVWSIFEDSKNRIWFGAEELYRINSSDLSEKGEIMDSKQGFTGSAIHSMMEDSEGNIWIGALDGLFKFNENEFKRYSTKDGLSSENIRVIHEDKSGVLWVGTISGLNKIENEKITQVSLNADPSKKMENEPYVRAIYEGEEGELWLGSYGNGLFRLKDRSVCNITANDGLFDNIVSHLIKDDNDNFWMSSNRGIFRIQSESALAFCSGQSNSVQSFSYGEKDGMISVETNGGFQPSIIHDSLGNIYLPTVGGVAVVSTKDIKINSIKPPVYIEKIRGINNDISIKKTVELSYDESFLEINYTAISFDKPEKTRFKFKLEGLNDNWIEAGNRREALYSKIPPGEYTFKVIASNSDGVWNDKGASIAIIVTPPFWQTNWFYGVVGLIFLTSGPAIYYYRVNQLKKENERQKRFTEQLIESEEQERSRIAAELHDGLGQQMLIIKNRAELAKKFIGDKETLEDQLDEIMQSAVISISDVRSMSYGLRPVHLERFGLTEAINNLFDQVKDTTEIEWDFEIPNIDELIVKNKEINFYRVLQEAVNNIIKHADATEASVHITRNDKGVKMLISDNGIGFDVNAKDNFVGLGLSGMQERIETLSGILEIISDINKGTTIKIMIPVNDE